MCTRVREGARDGQEFFAVLVLIPEHIVSRSEVLHNHCNLKSRPPIPIAQGGKVGGCTCTRYTCTYTHAQTYLHACKRAYVRSLIHAQTTCRYVYFHTHRIDTCIHVTCSLHTVSILSCMHMRMGPSCIAARAQDYERHMRSAYTYTRVVEGARELLKVHTKTTLFFWAVRESLSRRVKPERWVFCTV